MHRFTNKYTTTSQKTTLHQRYPDNARHSLYHTLVYPPGLANWSLNSTYLIKKGTLPFTLPSLSDCGRSETVVILQITAHEVGTAINGAKFEQLTMKPGQLNQILSGNSGRRQH
jgi:hypothetical protein